MELSPLQHIAVIMDGNGRWAKTRGLPRIEGHRQGVKAVQGLIEAVLEAEIPYLTIFSFSSENWQRPEDEVNELMQILYHSLESETSKLHEAGIKLKVIGSKQRLSDNIRSLIEEAENLTKENDQLTLCVALSYGSREEIIEATKVIAEQITSSALKIEDITEETFSKFLYTKEIPDPDLVLRTSGECRISNFLLWQSAYSEFMFIDKFWPDFTKQDLMDAINDFTKRERRYGVQLG